MTVDYDAPRRSPVDYDAPRRSPVDYDAPRRSPVDYDAPRRSPVDYDAPRRTPVDYDAPRRKRIDAAEPLDELAERRTDTDSPALLDIDEGDAAESYELPGADLSDEELVVRVLPRQADEFICSSCFLVHHRNRLARGRNGTSICTECA